MILVAAAVLVLALFLVSARDVLNPFVLFWVLAAVLLPFRGREGHVLLLATAAAVTGVWVLATTGYLLAPFVLALILAYILDPVVDRMEERLGSRIGRSLAIGILALPVAGLIALGIVAGLPALGEQIADLIGRTPVLLGRLADWLEGMRDRLLDVRFPGDADQVLLERLRGVDAESIVAFLEERQTQLGQRIWEGVLGLGRGVASVLTILLYIVLTPVLVFYLLRDYDRLIDAVSGLVPPSRRESVVSFFREYDRILSGFLRGQLTVALIVGTLIGVGFWIVGFPYALLLGALGGLFNVIPYLGPALSLIPAVLVALVTGDVLVSLLKVAGVIGVVQILESTVISPRIVGGFVGLHPVWVILAITVGGFFFGFVGLLVAVPVAAGIKLLVVRGVERYRRSDLYRDGPPVPGGGG